jgi:hypothetical protein
MRKLVNTALLMLFSMAAFANGEGPRNPWLADSAYPLTHANPAQQAAFAQAGPLDDSRRLQANEIEYNYLGPGNLIFVISGKYPNGERAAWSVGVNGISKQNYTRFKALPPLITHEEPFTESNAQAAEEKLKKPGSFSAMWEAVKTMSMLAEAGNLYTLIDRNNDFYVGMPDGTIHVYGDAVANDVNADIVFKRAFKLPANTSGKLVGMNMTFDGQLLALTADGDLLAISRDFNKHTLLRLSGAPAQAENDEMLDGWVRNSFAVDEDAVYIVSRDYMHKIIWDGQQFSEDEAKGAWRAAYPNSLGRGSGATPSLMGFNDDEHRFVVITDGNRRMNMTLFWRDAIPSDWQALADKTDRRIAASVAVDIAADHAVVQSEQSVLVAGMGALIVNNIPPHRPWYFPKDMVTILPGMLATHSEYRPQGMQKFLWDRDKRTLRSAWINNTVSSPNSVPLLSLGNDTVYTVGARGEDWTLEAVDWHSGKSRFHYLIGGPRYNSIYSPIVLDDNGQISYGSPWGRVRLSPEQKQ